MAGRVAYYGGIVKDGLVLDLDAAKKESYPGSGTRWNDIAGGVITGSLVNGPTFDSGNGGSIVFDGIDDYVLGNNITSYFTNQIYASVFYKLTSASNYPMVLTLGIAEGSEGFSIRHSSTSGYPEIVLSTSSTTTLSSLPIVLNQIVQIGLWYDGTTWKGYKNGVEFASASKTGNIQFGSAPLLRLGARSDGYYFPGNIYTTQIYNRALSATEITQNYNALKGRYGL